MSRKATCAKKDPKRVEAVIRAGGSVQFPEGFACAGCDMTWDSSHMTVIYDEPRCPHCDAAIVKCGSACEDGAVSYGTGGLEPCTYCYGRGEHCARTEDDGFYANGCRDWNRAAQDSFGQPAEVPRPLLLTKEGFSVVYNALVWFRVNEKRDHRWYLTTDIMEQIQALTPKAKAEGEEPR